MKEKIDYREYPLKDLPAGTLYHPALDTLMKLAPRFGWHSIKDELFLRTFLPNLSDIERDLRYKHSAYDSVLNSKVMLSEAITGYTKKAEIPEDHAYQLQLTALKYIVNKRKIREGIQIERKLLKWYPDMSAPGEAGRIVILREGDHPRTHRCLPIPDRISQNVIASLDRIGYEDSSTPKRISSRERAVVADNLDVLKVLVNYVPIPGDLDKVLGGW